MPAPAGRTFRELYRAAAATARSSADERTERYRADGRAEALAPRRIARHRERLRRAGRSQRAGPRRARTSSRSASASRISRRRRTCRRRRSRAIQDGKHGYTPSAGIDELRAAAAKDLGARRGLEIRPEDVVVGAGAKPFIAYTIASVTDYGAGDEVIYPVPGFPIYESQIVANGAVPVPIYLREARDFAFDPAELEAKITPKTKLLILNTPHNPTGGMLQRRRSRRDRRRSSRGIRRSGCSPTRSTRASSYAGAFDSLASRPGMLERTIISRRRVEDLGDDRLAHRLRRQPRARAGVHALDHQHRFVRVADLAMGGGRGDQRARRTRPTRCARASSSAAT